ncbi:MAG: dihydroorotate dehydrogenase electron transfer subunit [Clostridia bacterium]|nr:dihydroorotate dehydrogenase electron transfer subunit [Clostridia bacterium]
MKQGIFTIEKQVALNRNIFEMTLLGDISEIKAPGQFVNIKIDALYLRRPISVCSAYGGVLKIIYKVVGSGTEKMSRMKEGEKLDILSGLGNGYDVSKSGDRPLLIGGGVGVPPLYGLAENLIKNGKKTTVILGFNTKSEIFYENEFAKLGCDVYLTTVDGSAGIKGFVTDALSKDIDYSHYYACGPEAMLKAVHKNCQSEGQLSFERRMGCGFGACMGCSCKTITGNKRICKEGPVLSSKEVLW